MATFRPGPGQLPTIAELSQTLRARSASVVVLDVVVSVTVMVVLPESDGVCLRQ
jgi:hypothetical protein